MAIIGSDVVKDCFVSFVILCSLHCTLDKNFAFQLGICSFEATDVEGGEMTIIFVCAPPFAGFFLMDPVPVVVLVLVVFRDLVSLVSSDISVPVMDSFVSAILNVWFGRLWGHVETIKNIGTNTVDRMGLRM